jgi:hypothetical protein
MSHVVVKKYLNRFWRVADVIVDGVTVRTINRFYDISSHWITEYETTGGSGYGYAPGGVVWKYPIGEKSLEVRG